MSGIKPFQALYYNIDKVGDFTRVVSPPYDVISELQQEELHNLSPYNFTHIDLAKAKKGDSDKDNQYTRSKKLFDQWLKDEILIKDDKPSVYFYRQDYKVMGQKYSRLGFISLLELADEKDSKVKPHEKTHAHAVDDRFQLTKALNSNLSCIFVCYSDRQKKIENIFHKHIFSNDPIVDVVYEGIHHKLWRLSDPKMIDEINKTVEGQNLFIADGHHRYQVACDYRKEQIKNGNKSDASNYVMTYFTNLDSKDLQIFPMHRIVKDIDIDLEKLEEYFRIDKIRNKDDLLILLAKAGRNEHAFGLYTQEGIHLLRLKNKLLIDEHVKEGSKEYRSLDATILKSFIFDEAGIKPADIIYTKDFNECIDMVDNGSAQASFVMNAVRISELKDIALNGERMPQKTTYFYPKVLSGLTVYNMD